MTPYAADAEVSASTSRPRTPADRQPATGSLAAPPAALSPRTPFPASPPVIARIRGTGLEKPAFSEGRFFGGGSVSASSLRRTPFGLRRPARVPWRPPGTRGTRSLPGRLAASRTPRHSPAATLARAHPHAAALGGSAASAATRPRPQAHTRSTCCARHTGSGTGLPHGVERRYHPAHVWQALPGVAPRRLGGSRPPSSPVRSPPLACRSDIFVGQRTGCHVAGSLRTGCARRLSHVPGVATAPLRVERLPRDLPRAHRPAAASQPHRDRHRLPHGVTG